MLEGDRVRERAIGPSLGDRTDAAVHGDREEDECTLTQRGPELRTFAGTMLGFAGVVRRGSSR